MGATTTKKFHNKIKSEFVKKIEKQREFVKKVDVMLDSLHSLLAKAKIDEYCLFLSCKEKLKAITFNFPLH